MNHRARRPNIGVTPDLLVEQPPVESAAYRLKVAYADAVIRAGGLPLILPYSEDRSCVDSYLDRVSGLVVTGGAFDVSPELYGESARPGLGVLKESRTAFEAALIRGALERSLPLLGVCGGMQLLNVVAGGTLIQDIGREVANAAEHEQTHDRTQPQHPVEIKDGTLLAELLGKGQVMVNSTHHQAVSKPGKGVVVSAVATDGVVEAIEMPAHPFALGLQWHPELLINAIPLHLGVYRGLVNKAREMRR
jgi:putative glutamine amidotransferase